MKFTVTAPNGEYCESNKQKCPCLGLDGCESEYCGYFHKELDADNRGTTEKCDECLLMQKMLRQEVEK